MAVKKDDLKINESNYYRTPTFNDDPTRQTVDYFHQGDPGRIALSQKFSHDEWKVIMRFNGVVDPIEEIATGKIALIPSKTDVNAIKTF